MTMFVCKSDIPLEDACLNLQAEYDLPLFVFDEHSTWKYAISHGTGIKFNVTKTQEAKTLTTWSSGIPDNVNYQIIVSITSDEYSTQSIKRFLGKMFLTDIIEIQNTGSWNLQNNFTNHDDFDKYVREQDKWVFDNQWSYPEHNISAYLLERFGKYEAGKLIEYIIMSRGEGLTNSIHVTYCRGKESHHIWSGYIDSPNEYQVMMAVVNEFIEEYKNNSGAI